MTEESSGGPRERPAIRVTSKKPPQLLYVVANRSGYLALRDVLGKLAEAPAGAFASKTKDAREAGKAITESLVPGSQYLFMECALDEALSHEPPPRKARLAWLRDRVGLLGCAGLVTGALLALAVFLRGLAAFWQDIR